MNRQEKNQFVRDSGLVAIIRAKSSLTEAQLSGIAKALEEGGVRSMEITLTTPDALKLVRAAKEFLGAGILFGVGSVVSENDAKQAIDAGADFLVTPTLSVPVIKLANSYETPIFAGCYTPTEAQTAYEAGADFIKLFPAEFGGPALVKAILAPLPHLAIVPVGGVSAETAGSFIKAGAVALGVGSSLVNQERIDKGDFAGIKAEAIKLSKAISEVR